MGFNHRHRPVGSVRDHDHRPLEPVELVEQSADPMLLVVRRYHDRTVGGRNGAHLSHRPLLHSASALLRPRTRPIITHYARVAVNNPAFRWNLFWSTVRQISAMTSYLDRLRAEGERANPFFSWMGIRVIRADGGVGELELDVRPDLWNGEGWVQGGLYTALADEAVVLAVYQTLEEGETIASITESTAFLRGVNQGKLRAVGRVTKRGRRVIFGEGQVSDDEGRLCSTTTVSYAVSRR
ncbi:Proofreading thioesterase EntH [anaerobic digester metagenome]